MIQATAWFGLRRGGPWAFWALLLSGLVALGVILSGTAADGTLGLQAIKAAGGTTFAQEPTSAQFDGMLLSAIAAGCVDFVGSPEDIARELTRISRHPYVRQPPAADTEEEAAPAEQALPGREQETVPDGVLALPCRKISGKWIVQIPLIYKDS